MIFNILITISCLIMLLGAYGVIFKKKFLNKILSVSKIDILSGYTLVLALLLKHGFSFFSLKLILILFIMFITNPLSSYLIANYSYNNRKKKR